MYCFKTNLSRTFGFFLLRENYLGLGSRPITQILKTNVYLYSIAKSNYVVELEKAIETDIIQGKYKPRKHPGILKINSVGLPSYLLDAVNEVIKDVPQKSLHEHAAKLSRYLHSRCAPVEGEEIKEKRNYVKDKLFIEGKLPTMQLEPTVSEDILPVEERRTINTTLSKAIYNWKPIEYDDYTSLVYLIARLAPDFGSLVKIFQEIKRRNGEFQPLTFFDFGSGVGSGFWALNQVWPEICKEAYFVDSSSSMNSLAERLLKGGDPEGKSIGPKSLFFRQFLPASSALQYDLVLSSRTIYEIGDLKARAMTADILWRKVKPGGFLVFVENSTNSSYKMLMELRDFLLEINQSRNKNGTTQDSIHVFSPCPHDKFCPRFFHKSDSSCHFEVKYQPPNLPTSKMDHFSYVVFQKARRVNNWPRIVQPVLERHNHVIIRTCTSEADIQPLVVTKKKHGALCYKICKTCNWGDQLPVKLVPISEVDTEEIDTNNTFPDDNTILYENVDSNVK